MVRAVWLLLGLAVFVAAGAAGVLLSLGSAALSKPDSATRQLVARARRALDSGAYLEVVRLTSQVPDEWPDAAEVRLWRGVALWKLERWEAAEQQWHRALEIDPEVPEASWRLLITYFHQVRSAEAEELVLKLYPIEPDPEDRVRLLLELVRQDNERVGPEATVKTLEPVLVQEPENFHALRVLGSSYVQLGRVREGAALIERALRLRPNDIEGRFTLVWYLFETGRIELLGRAWEQMPRSVWEEARFLRYRGMWAEAVGDVSEAERAHRAAIGRDPADRKAHYQLARLLRARGAEEEGAKHEAEARQLDDAREQLATFYLRSTQPNFQISAEDCRQASRLCSRLARKRQAECWEREASRR